MLDPVPVAPPVTNVADGPWWVVLVTGLITLIGGWLPFHYGRKGVKPAAADGSVPAKPLDPVPPAPTGARVTVDLPKPVSVTEGSPEWLIVHMVNNLEHRIDAAERRAEEVQRDAQKRYDALDKRWRERYEALDKKFEDQQKELFDSRSDVRDLTAEVHRLQGRLTGGPPP